MDERFALTRTVATKIVKHLDVKAFSNGSNESCWFLQQVNNALILFPAILDSGKHREQIYLATLAVTRKQNKLANRDADMWCVYASEFITTVSGLLGSFSPAQQRVLRQSIEPLNALADQQQQRLLLDRVRSLFFDEDPLVSAHLANVKLGSSSVSLDHLPRSRCDTCHLSNQPFYCTRCYAVLHPDAHTVIPRVKLPFELHIVVHSEYDVSKSTAFHARLICDPGQVHVHVWPTIPHFDSDTVLLFPSTSSVSVDDAHSLLATNNKSLNRFVMIEATWPQAAQIVCHPRLSHLLHVQLKAGTTQFWRHQSISPSYLSSIETIHAFTTHWCVVAGKDTHQFDDLLWLFTLGWRRVRAYYKQRPALLVPPPHALVTD